MRRHERSWEGLPGEVLALGSSADDDVATVEPGDDAVGAFSRRLRGGGIEQLLPERGQ